MTEEDVIAHWKQGARDAMEVAKAARELGKYSLALFNAHLAVEKTLKACFMEERREEAPTTHNLVLVAEQLKRKWSVEERRRLDFLTQYAIAARYDDPAWAEHEATAENADRWLDVADGFLSNLLS